MTIEASVSPRVEYDVIRLEKEDVVLQAVEHCGKIYTIKIFLDKSWERTGDNSAKLEDTIQRVKQILGIFVEKLGDDSSITITTNGKLFIGEGDDEERESYDCAFRDCSPAHKIQVVVGYVNKKAVLSSDDLTSEEKSDAALLEEELDFCEPLSSHFSEIDTLLFESKLKEVERRNQSTGNSELSAFFFVLAGAVAQENIDPMGFKSVLGAAEVWAESSGIVKNKSLMEHLVNGLGRLSRLYEDPSQENLRKLVKDPIDHSSVNFALRQLALMAIYYHLDMVKNTMEGESHDQASVEKQQKLLFNQAKIPGNEVNIEIIAILQQLFRLEYSVFSDDSTQKSFRIAHPSSNTQSTSG